MFAYIFDNVEELTRNWHCGGGLVVIAKDRREARKLISTDENIKLTEHEWKRVQRYRLADDVEAKMFIFPDAGCC